MLQRSVLTHDNEQLELPKRVRDYLNTGGRAPSPEGQPGRVRTATIVLAVAFAVSVAIAALASGGLAVLGGFLATVLFIAALVALSRDLRIPAPRDRSTPRKAASCWAKALRFGQYGKAFHCHHPDLLPEELWTDAMPTLFVGAKQHSLVTFAGFKAMWKSFFGPTGSTNRVVRNVFVGDPVVQDDVAECQVMIEVVRYSSWVYAGLLGGVLPVLLLYLVNRRIGVVGVNLQLFRHGSQWWVVPPIPEETTQARPAPRVPVARVQ